MIGKGNRFLSLLLCAVLTLSLFAAPVHAEDDHDHDLEASTLAVSEAAPLASTASESSQVCPVHGDHHVYDQEVDTGETPECPAVKGIYWRECLCGDRIGKTSGDHMWGNDATIPATCTTPGSRTRQCTRCKTEETEPIPVTAHPYKTVTVAATATNCPVTYKQCTVCGHIDGNTEPEAHTWVKTANDCTMTAFCSKCGAKDTVDKVQVMHKFGGEYYKTADGHYQKCQNAGCDVTSAVTAHTAQSVSGDCTKGTTCRVCGYEGLTGLEHNYSTNWVISLSASGHVVRCTNSGCNVTKTVAHTPGTADKCTDSVKCTVCSYTITPGGSHAFGPITGGDNLGCIRTCTKCGEAEHISHTGKNDDGDCTTPVTCAVCGYTLVPGYADHDYSSTVWISDGAGGHYTLCSHPGCLSRHTDAHSGGTATCASPAVCSVCGAGYGAKDPNNHAGGTEIRNAKAAGAGVPGYTGDTYCLGCNVMLASGSVIPALTEAHTHSYSAAWASDSTGHWHECACGDKKDLAAHTFREGKCTVCGETDPDYKEAEAHIHTYSGVWSGDSQYHWHECTVCGEKADQDVHRFLNDVCIECGMTFEQHKEEEKKEQEGAEPPVTDPEPTEPKWTNPYGDVKEGKWYYDDVKFMYESGLMVGKDDGSAFGVGENLTRGDMALILYRMAGEPKVTGQCVFTDVQKNYYKNAIIWAQQKGIIDGDGGLFRPDANITRQEIVKVLYEYARVMGLDVSARGDLSVFSDGSATSGWAKASMVWAVGAGVFEGGDGLLKPTANALREEIAALLTRFCKNIAK